MVWAALLVNTDDLQRGPWLLLPADNHRCVASKTRVLAAYHMAMGNVECIAHRILPSIDLSVSLFTWYQRLLVPSASVPGNKSGPPSAAYLEAPIVLSGQP